jgi:hypothetical protein
LLTGVQRSSVGYSLAHWKNICPMRPEFGLKENILFLEIVYFLFGGEAKLRRAGGAQRPVGRGNELKKTGARSARARTRGQNPLVSSIDVSTLGTTAAVENSEKIVVDH